MLLSFSSPLAIKGKVGGLSTLFYHERTFFHMDMLIELVVIRVFARVCPDGGVAVIEEDTIKENSTSLSL